MTRSEDAYRRLIADLEARCIHLASIHGPHLACRKGCDQCCVDIAVLPIEHYVMKQTLPTLSGVRRKENERCIFLMDGFCTVYPIRPVICRAHGLPLKYRVEDWSKEKSGIGRETAEAFLTWCDLNFTLAPPEMGRNVLDMTELNSLLMEINNLFLSTPEGTRYRAGQWIHLSDLLDR